MNERPIIMGAESVRAILEGRKTQTRRVIKPSVNGCTVGVYTAYNPPIVTDVVNVDKDGDPYEDIFCPYGKVGDRLWVRETFKIAEGVTINGIAPVIYKADCSGFALANIDNWKSPLFMPRWASRITLEITDIRVERVQDISICEAIDEGIPSQGVEFDPKHGSRFVDVVPEYKRLWDSLNAKRGYPWEKNPWVWVISFKVVQP